MNKMLKENAEVLQRMKDHGMDMTQAHEVEFFMVFRTEEDADAVARKYAKEFEDDETVVNIETYPHEIGGMELLIVRKLALDNHVITGVEADLTNRIVGYDARMDGWGVLQD